MRRFLDIFRENDYNADTFYFSLTEFDDLS